MAIESSLTQQIDEMIEEVDGSGTKFMMTGSERNNKEELTKAFNIIDIDKNGKISSQDIKNIAKELGIRFTDAEIQSMVVEADCDYDGEVNIEEFMRMMKTPS